MPAGSAAACTSCAIASRTPASRAAPWSPPPIRTAFVQETEEAARAESAARRRRSTACQVPQASGVTGRRRERGARRHGLPKSHWSRITSTNPIERLNREIKAAHQRRSDLPQPGRATIVRLIGAILLEQNDEWAVSRRYMSLETLAGLDDQQAQQQGHPGRLCPQPAEGPSTMIACMTCRALPAAVRADDVFLRSVAPQASFVGASGMRPWY